MIRSLGGMAPRIHPTAFVSEFAYVIGDVVVEAGASIWPGVVVRADMGRITIGEHTSVQDNSVVHGDTDVVIGDRVVIGHMVLCHAKTVGDRVLLGSGSTVNEGVEIGEDSLIASGAVLADFVKIPPRSLVVGVPGKIRGPVRDRHIDLISKLCESYIAKIKRYKVEDNLESHKDS